MVFLVLGGHLVFPGNIYRLYLKLEFVEHNLFWIFRDFNAICIVHIKNWNTFLNEFVRLFLITFKVDLSRQECSDKLKSVYGYEVLSQSNLIWWIQLWSTLALERIPSSSFKIYSSAKKDRCCPWIDKIRVLCDISWD